MTINLTLLEQISSKIAAHLTSQRKRSFDHGTCLYRSPCGAMCAVGAIIPDHLYDSSLEENTAADSLVWNRIEAALDLANENTATQQALQTVLTRWQEYHDFGTSLAFVGLNEEASYERWIKNSGTGLAPSAFHHHLMSGYTLIKSVDSELS